jgi:hypothetical protein
MKVQDVYELCHHITAACETINASDAAKHLVRGGVSFGHLLGHQGYTCGDLLKTSELGNFMHLSLQFTCFFLY